MNGRIEVWNMGVEVRWNGKVDFEMVSFGFCVIGFWGF